MIIAVDLPDHKDFMRLVDFLGLNNMKFTVGATISTVCGCGAKRPAQDHLDQNSNSEDGSPATNKRARLVESSCSPIPSVISETGSINYGLPSSSTNSQNIVNKQPNQTTSQNSAVAQYINLKRLPTPKDRRNKEVSINMKEEKQETLNLPIVKIEEPNVIEPAVVPELTVKDVMKDVIKLFGSNLPAQVSSYLEENDETDDDVTSSINPLGSFVESFLNNPTSMDSPRDSSPQPPRRGSKRLRKCTKCDKFLSVNDLEKRMNHAQTHMNIKRYRCSICEMTTRQAANIYAHIRLKHSDHPGAGYVDTLSSEEEANLRKFAEECFPPENTILV